MPRVPDNVLWSTGFIYRCVKDAEAGLSPDGATAFVVSIHPDSRPRGSQWTHKYAVTNRHVIARGGRVLRIDAPDEPVAGRPMGTDIIGPPHLEWVLHPDGDDLAVAYLTPHLMDKRINYAHWAVDKQAFLAKGTVEKFGIGPGDEVFTVGRLIGAEGGKNQIPTVRFGHISSNLEVPILQDPKTGIRQESIIVEIFSIGGFSGAPVILRIPHLYTRATSSMNQWDFGPWLLGVNWGHLANSLEPIVDEKGEEIEGRRLRRNSGLMTVVPAWKLDELLMSDELVTERRDLEREVNRIVEKHRKRI